jgi:hypothetical protein
MEEIDAAAGSRRKKSRELLASRGPVAGFLYRVRLG